VLQEDGGSQISGSTGPAAVVNAPLAGSLSNAVTGRNEVVVLCIDDDDVHQMIMQNMLSSQQYR
jgi:hypothetical protein